MKIYRDENEKWSFDFKGEHYTFMTREQARIAKRELREKIESNQMVVDETPKVDTSDFIDMVLTAGSKLEEKLLSLMPYQIGITQARALVLIGDDEVRQKYLVSNLGLTRAAVSSIVKLLKKQKLVVNNKGLTIKLTPKGHLLAVCFKNVVSKLQRNLEDNFTNEELGGFIKVYKGIVEG